MANWTGTIVCVVADPNSNNLLLLATYTSDASGSFSPPPVPSNSWTDVSIAQWIANVCQNLGNRDAAATALTVTKGSPVPIPTPDPIVAATQAQQQAYLAVLNAANALQLLNNAVPAGDPSLDVANNNLQNALTAHATAAAVLQPLSTDFAAKLQPFVSLSAASLSVPLSVAKPG